MRSRHVQTMWQMAFRKGAGGGEEGGGGALIGTQLLDGMRASTGNTDHAMRHMQTRSTSDCSKHHAGDVPDGMEEYS